MDKFRTCSIIYILYIQFDWNHQLSMQNLNLQQRKKSWQTISGKSRFQYLAPAPRSPYKEEPGIDYELDPSAGPLDAFSLLILEPDQVCIIFSAFMRFNIPKQFDRHRSIFYDHFFPLVFGICIASLPGLFQLRNLQERKHDIWMDILFFVVLFVTQVDYINLKSDERWIFTLRMSDTDKIWMPERVNP